jgi:hypothetical protein
VWPRIVFVSILRKAKFCGVPTGTIVKSGCAVGKKHVAEHWPAPTVGEESRVRILHTRCRKEYMSISRRVRQQFRILHNEGLHELNAGYRSRRVKI